MPGRLRYVGRYIIEDRTLGKGNFAVVELATHGITKTKVAIKVIDRSKIREEYVRENLFREARILAQLRHPNVVRLYETISSSSLYCLVTEYAGGGDLLSFVRGQREGRLSEAVARPFVRQLVSALHHLHERGVVHRDLKMENIMLDEKRKNLKIVDFGLSNTYSADCLLKTHCGSPEYAAPELFITDQEYGPEVDIWSLGINMFAMVTGRLPFSTPYSENRRQRLMLQIQNGLGVIHGREMAHLSEECQELLSQLIEPSPELRLPLLDIEIHPWITSQGQTPFCPYQQPPKDLEVRRMIIDKMACLLNVSAAKIDASVHEYRLDDVSAIYNLMLDQHRLSRGFWDMDHTIKREVKHPKTVVTAPRPKTPPTPQEERDREEERIELRTPTIIGMVRPSRKNPERRTCLSADFELSAVSTDERPRQNRAKTATFPQTAAKTRPIGNATTANSVLARHYHFGARSSSTQQPKVCSCPPKPPTAETTHHVHHSSTPAQPIGTDDRHLPGSEQPITNSVSKDEDLHAEVTQAANHQSQPEGDGPMGDGVSQQYGTRQPIRKAPVPGVDGLIHSEDDRISRVKTNAESAHDVKVIDMAKYFNFKHGYIIKETLLSNSNSQRSQQMGEEGLQDESLPVRLCDTHRDRIILETLSKHDTPSCRSSRAGSPAKSTSQRTELLRQQMQLPARPVNAHFHPRHAKPSLQKGVLLTKRVWHARYSQQANRAGGKGKEGPASREATLSGSNQAGHQGNCSTSRSACDSPRARLHTPVAVLHSTEDCERSSRAQAWQGEPTRVGAQKRGTGRNAMPLRLDWKKMGSVKPRGRPDNDEADQAAGVEVGRGVSNTRKLQEMISRDSIHQRVPSGNIRVKSAKMETPKKERCRSPQRKGAVLGTSTSRRIPTSDMHKSCTEQAYRGPYIMEKYKDQHQRSHTHPAGKRDRVIDLSQQHMFSLLQEASTKFEDTLKKAEKRKQHQGFRTGSQASCQKENKPTQSTSDSQRAKHLQQHQQQTIHGEGPSLNNQPNATEGTVALQLGQRVQLVKGSLAISSQPPPVLPSSMAPEHVFNVQASRDVQSVQPEPTKSKQGPHHKGNNRSRSNRDWDAGYRLERKVSDTIKRSGSAVGKTPDLLLNCT